MVTFFYEKNYYNCNLLYCKTLSYFIYEYPEPLFNDDQMNYFDLQGCSTGTGTGRALFFGGKGQCPGTNLPIYPGQNNLPGQENCPFPHLPEYLPRQIPKFCPPLVRFIQYFFFLIFNYINYLINLLLSYFIKN